MTSQGKMDLNGLGPLSLEIWRNGPFQIYHFPSIPFLQPQDGVHLKMDINSPFFSLMFLVYPFPTRIFITVVQRQVNVITPLTGSLYEE
jgi:hypothetical protein